MASLASGDTCEILVSGQTDGAVALLRIPNDDDLIPQAAVTLMRQTGSGAGTVGDQGDTFDTATSVSVPSTTAGELEEGGDRDYFRVVVAAATTLTVETAGGTDTYGTLFDGSEGMMARDDDGGAGNNFRIEESVEPGTYYVEVRGYASSTTGAYELRVSAADADEPPVSDGECYVGLLVNPGESCTYPGTTDEFTVTGDGRGRFLFFTAGNQINLRNSNINGRVYNFVATHRGGGVWRIDEVG